MDFVSALLSLNHTELNENEGIRILGNKSSEVKNISYS